MSLLAVHVSSLVKYLSVFCLFYIRFVFYYWDLGVLGIFLIQVLCQIYVLWIFCPIYGLSFQFLNNVFDKQNFNFSKIWLTIFLSCFFPSTSYLRNLCLSCECEVSIMFSLRSSIGLAFIFWFMIHAKLIFVIHYL